MRSRPATRQEVELLRQPVPARQVFRGEGHHHTENLLGGAVRIGCGAAGLGLEGSGDVLQEPASGVLAVRQGWRRRRNGGFCVIFILYVILTSVICTLYSAIWCYTLCKSFSYKVCI